MLHRQTLFCQAPQLHAVETSGIVENAGTIYDRLAPQLHTMLSCDSRIFHHSVASHNGVVLGNQNFIGA